MKKSLLIPAVIILIAAAINSCKLDPPILPGDPGYVQEYPPGGGTTTGGTGTTTSILDSALLAGNWTVQSTYVGGYINGAYSEGTAYPGNEFTSININTTTKTGIVTELLGTTDTLKYTLSTSGSNLYITFSADPLVRSANNKIQIVKLTSSAMQWYGSDPQIVTVSGYTEQAVTTVNFTK